MQYNAEGPDATVGWWYNWHARPNEWSFNQAFEQEALEKSTFMPMWSWVRNEMDPFELRANPEIVAAEPIFGSFNEPYGHNQANLTAQEAVDLWPRFLARREALAEALGISADEIKIVSPSISPTSDGALWAEEFFALAKENDLHFDYINVHSYAVNNGCDCPKELLRDHMSHIRFKYDLPIFLTEFNCGGLYWQCSVDDHKNYMSEALPMLETHPWVPRYNWMSALVELPEANLNRGDDYALTELGHQYNNYQWDGEVGDNPQWTQGPTWTGRWRN